MKKAIIMGDNLSTPELNRQTYPIFKYEKDDAVELMINIMRMMVILQKYPES
jgi:hypothetical protein